MFIEANKNPHGKLVGDCVIRAISIATEKDWEKTYVEIAIQGFLMGDMPSSNSVWGAYLQDNGFTKEVCKWCGSVRDFCKSHPLGTYILATGSHVVAIIDGDYYDTWDSGDEYPVFYFKKEE